MGLKAIEARMNAGHLDKPDLHNLTESRNVCCPAGYSQTLYRFTIKVMALTIDCDCIGRRLPF